MKHVWRPPAFSRDRSNKSGKPAWLKFVTDSHLEWLMDMVDRIRRHEALDDEDAECYSVIKEQAETFMARAKLENWSEEDKRVRMLAWHGSNMTGR